MGTLALIATEHHETTAEAIEFVAFFGFLAVMVWVMFR